MKNIRSSFVCLKCRDQIQLINKGLGWSFGILFYGCWNLYLALERSAEFAPDFNHRFTTFFSNYFVAHKIIDLVTEKSFES